MFAEHCSAAWSTCGVALLGVPAERVRSVVDPEHEIPGVLRLDAAEIFGAGATAPGRRALLLDVAPRAVLLTVGAKVRLGRVSARDMQPLPRVVAELLAPMGVRCLVPVDGRFALWLDVDRLLEAFARDPRPDDA